MAAYLLVYPYWSSLLALRCRFELSGNLGIRSLRSSDLRLTEVMEGLEVGSITP